MLVMHMQIDENGKYTISYIKKDEEIITQFNPDTNKTDLSMMTAYINEKCKMIYESENETKEEECIITGLKHDIEKGHILYFDDIEGEKDIES